MLFPELLTHCIDFLQLYGGFANGDEADTVGDAAGAGVAASAGFGWGSLRNARAERSASAAIAGIPTTEA